MSEPAARALVADLHVHYPMHVLSGDRDVTLGRMVRVRRRAGAGSRARGAILWLASRLLNYRSWDAGPRVTADFLAAGGVRVALSVLYSPFDEMDLGERYGAPPTPGYFGRLLEQLEQVEDEIGAHASATVVHDEAELDRALGDGVVGLVHCVEGGFHLGPTPADVDANVTALAARGVAYVTLAHLFWRRVAANAPAIPFLPDPLYDLLFPQKAGSGLTELGEAAVRAMYRERMLIDVAHMRGDALAETFELLDALDRESGAAPGAHPVIASHSGYRFGRQTYNLDDDAVLRIAARGGVIGLILAQHQLNDGIRKRTTTFEESFEVIARHADRLRELTGSHEHTAVGSDFDGFIKPTMGGLERSSDLARLPAALRDRYGPEDAERILSGNVLRVLRATLRPAAPPAPR
jgi:microsomal dipeptidase-like Zn-dependent dipeptidase